MFFEETGLEAFSRKIGFKLGYIFSYFVFTTMLFLIFGWLNKTPSGWTYFSFMAVTAGIALVGLILKRLLR